ncbi:Mitochondrial intermediate peptidase [Ophidiomyces ophidiicola]|uniref:Mitochondrial intermediate peptidase n=1 Tax=Ophidiomyces ophidiicola TaxID=1387563 RepID=A0ACB8UQP9_9EURO|nr:Mitochondrial intermediate peptidase [Ophidiomyces ophidiicola]KAI1949012.1 Mitochondrial intermediate peptidase [Ophidiomyces ophidiicola]KAI1958711.1 Mitochondrial intermediate peptidase [Ophidiomyces ophidiicola]KAI1970210.1 Mitochondrial intermediate peptidase [Ophidiomyces ophidiicola]KAI2006724.1 Mitochondrial intermediate peptidase [Ophidiomyces ophidiicola]
MIKSLSRAPWTCRRCFLQIRAESRRHFQGASTVTPLHPYTLAGDSSNQKHDDQALRLVFDSKPFWKEFSHRRTGGSKQTGLLQNVYLTGPDGFLQFAQISLQKCQKIVAKVIAAQTSEEYREIVQNLDRMSDLLCRVIDIADFMKVNHPDREIQDAATQAYALMFEYMNVLNTTPELNTQLKQACADPNITALWNKEETVSAQVLLKDFSQSAIHLPPKDRQRFVALSNEISQLGPMFVQNVSPEIEYLRIEKNKARGMDPALIQELQRWSKVSLPLFSNIPRIALYSIHDEDTRRKIYMASRTSSRVQIERLETLLRKRAELAKLAGFTSYGHMTLSDKMAKTPEAVVNFLETLNSCNRVHVQGELSKLFALKQAMVPSATRLVPWDHSYYAHQYSAHHSRARKSRDSALLPAFFSIGTVMQGLSRLFSRLYGIRLAPTEILPGETWNPDVRRLDVLDESGRCLAVIYCDLFERSNKSPNPTHYTLRGSRAISQAEIAESASATYLHPNDGMASGVRPGTNTLYQLPTVALICNFHHSRDGSTPPLLDEDSLGTLFHEMGHAIHSVLACTDLQSISGTRCATDFVELPSVLMESFATSPEVLSLYARHWETNEPLPEQMLQTLKMNRQSRNSVHGGMDDEVQILMALLDQAYHSSQPLEPGFNSTRVYHDINSAYSSLPDPLDSSTSWQGFFPHLVGYGASYYSYLFDRAIANKVWTDVFQKGTLALDRDAGERFKNEVLRWGGGRDGWSCIAGLLGNNPANENGRLVEGGEDAMREVGRWGLGLMGSPE